MNKRIKELAEQAGYPDYMTYGQDLVLERFADLIVQECIKELEATQVCDSYTGKMIDCDYNDALADGIASIKENFGVE